MDVSALKARFDIKELELNSLLEITQAINNNLPETSLYKIYDFTLRANLNLKKLALYVLDEQWNCKVNFGTKNNYFNSPLDEDFLKYDKIQNLKSSSTDTPFREFDLLVPVAHKDRILALVFVTGDNTDINTNFIQALSNIIIVAIENKKLARKQIEQEVLRRELEIAGNVQKYLFPKDLPYTDKVKFATFYQPHHTIGGDYYDFVRINEDQFLFCIADVSGKGIPAAILMSNFQASLRTLTRQTTLLQEIITELNYQVMSNAEGQHFITFFVAIYDQSKGRFKYVNSGHNPPILIHDGKTKYLQEGSTVLGAFNELPFLNVGIIENLDEFLFCAFTDGLTEITNNSGEEFGEQRISEVMEEHINDEPQEINDAIINRLNDFKEGNFYKDDITLMTCRVLK